MHFRGIGFVWWARSKVYLCGRLARAVGIARADLSSV